MGTLYCLDPAAKYQIVARSKIPPTTTTVQFILDARLPTTGRKNGNCQNTMPTTSQPMERMLTSNPHFPI